MRLAPEPAWAEVPAEVGRLRLAAVELGAVTEVLSLGRADVSAALEAAVGVAMPAPGGSAAAGAVRVVWSGRDAALVLGARVEIDGAVCVDQSDGWAALELQGAVRDVLARLCPVDLRDRAFRVGATARTLLNHIHVSLTRTSEETWLVLMPRSMAGTVLDEIAEAARGVAAR